MDTKRIRILLLEDEPAHAEAIRRVLESEGLNFETNVVGLLLEYRQSVAVKPPDIALLDMVLPDGNALELLASSPEANVFPVIILTSHGNEQAAVAAMKAGAMDYIVKSPEAFADMPRTLSRTLNYWELLQERKMAVEALKVSEEKYRQLVNNLSEGIWVIDQDSVTTFVNPSLAEMLGYNTAEMLGRRVLSFTDEQNAKRAVPYLARLKEGLKEQIAFEFLRKDGERVYVSLQMSPVIDKDGNYSGAIAGVQNVTERQKLQDQLTAQDRLVTIGQFASGIAHELNNPLTGVIGFSELLLRRDLPADVKADLEIVNREAQRAAVIVKGLLTFARKPGTAKTPVDINRIIQEILQLRSYEQKVCNIVVNNRCAPDLPEITANGAQLQQAFINLIINAEQSMLEAHNKGTLTIVTERVGDILKVSIADDGPGISPENMSKIFTPFFTTKEVGKGTGLGLSICYGIITEHGGKIYCQSQPGKGATFVVELPIGKVAEQNITS